MGTVFKFALEWKKEKGAEHEIIISADIEGLLELSTGMKRIPGKKEYEYFAVK